MTTLLDEEVGRDHRLLDSEAEALGGALSSELPPRSQWVVLSWTVSDLWPTLELHFRKERAVLFPALRRVLGKEAGAITLLEESQPKLRLSVRHLSELLQDPGNLDWDRIPLAVQGFIYMWEEHEQMEKRLLLRVLEEQMSPHDLERTATAFHREGEKAREEEGWPRPAQAVDEPSPITQ